MSERPDGKDRRFLERLCRRDERAFNELVETYELRVFQLLFRMLGRRDEAEDLTQEVFVQIFKSIDQFRGDARLGTWIYRIAINLSKNRILYLSRRAADSQDELSESRSLSRTSIPTYSDVARPDQMVEGYQVERIVKLAIDRLEPDFKEMVILRDVEDLSYEEIAEITGLAEGTVKSRIHRARSMLKAQVERMLGEKIT